MSANPSPIARHFRELARTQGHVWDLDISKLICPYLPICDPVVDGKIVWYDMSHISDSYSRTLTNPMRELFTANAIGTG